jgi:hypothetical protein
MPFALGRDLWPASSPSVTLTPRSRSTDKAF